MCPSCLQKCSTSSEMDSSRPLKVSCGNRQHVVKSRYFKLQVGPLWIEQVFSSVTYWSLIGLRSGEFSQGQVHIFNSFMIHKPSRNNYCVAEEHIILHHQVIPEGIKGFMHSVLCQTQRPLFISWWCSDAHVLTKGYFSNRQESAWALWPVCPFTAYYVGSLMRSVFWHCSTDSISCNSNSSEGSDITYQPSLAIIISEP